MSMPTTYLIHFSICLTNEHSPSQRFQQMLASVEGTASHAINHYVHTIRAVFQQLLLVAVMAQWMCDTILSHCIMLPWGTRTKNGNSPY
jgi:hypothetical protein